MSLSEGEIAAVFGEPLRHGIEQVDFPERREQSAQMHGVGVELAKGFLEPQAANLMYEVSCSLFVENRPATDGPFVCSAFRPPEEKRSRMLGLNDQRFQAPSSHDSKVAVGHKDLSTTVCRYK